MSLASWIHSVFQNWINNRPFSSAEIKILFCQLGKDASTASDGFPFNFVATWDWLWWYPDFVFDITLRLIHLGNVSTNAGWIMVKFGEGIHCVWKINPNDFGEWPPFKNQLQVRLFKVTGCNFSLVIKLSILWISESRFCRVIYRTDVRVTSKKKSCKWPEKSYISMIFTEDANPRDIGTVYSQSQGLKPQHPQSSMKALIKGNSCEIQKLNIHNELILIIVTLLTCYEMLSTCMRTAVSLHSGVDL